MSDMERFGKLIVQARKARGWTVREAGEHLRRQGSYVSRLENAKNANPPSSTEFREIMQGLGISPVEGMIALGYLTPEDVGRADEPSDPALPASIQTLLADIEWNPRNTARAKTMLETIKDTQRPQPPGAGDLRERERGTEEGVSGS